MTVVVGSDTPVVCFSSFEQKKSHVDVTQKGQAVGHTAVGSVRQQSAILLTYNKLNSNVYEIRPYYAIQVEWLTGSQV